MIVVALLLAAAVLCGLSGSVPALARHDNTPAAAPAAGRMGYEYQLSQPEVFSDPDRYGPAVAGNWFDGYLVVWHRAPTGAGPGICARRVAVNGAPEDWFAISLGNKAHPAVAFNWDDAEYLVVWMEDVSGNGTRWAIKGKIIPWSGAGSNPELTIAESSTLSCREPSVAYNAWHDEYMVIWDTRAVDSQVATSIARRRVMPDGSMPYAWNSFTTDMSPQQSDIAYSHFEQEYLVVWVREYPPAPGGTGSDIWGARLTADGSLVDGKVFSITHSTKNETRPAVSSNWSDRYMVTFEYEYSDTDTDIYGQELDGAGNKVGPSPFQIASTTKDETEPDVVATVMVSGDYFAAWQRTEGTVPDAYESIWARRWGSGVTDHTFKVTPRASWDNWTPAVATDWWGGSHFMAYAGRDLLVPGGKRHIYGRIWWPEAVYAPLVLKGD